MKSTKKSLLISILSITLCVAMLLGTTYAWFTDSVQSGINTIQAGNLDVELYHVNPKLIQAKKAAGETEPTPEKVDSNTKLFTNVELWEPGAFAMEVLSVANEGDLALKYNLGINFDNETKVGGHGLSEVLKVGVLTMEEQKPLETREQFVNYITENGKWKPLASFSESGNLEAENDNSWSAKMYVIYWEPTDHDNDFNMNNGNHGQKLTIDLGVNLVATQDTVETDSFGIDYDENAGFLAATPEKLGEILKNIKSGDSVTLSKDANYTTKELMNIPNTVSEVSINGAVDEDGKPLTKMTADKDTKATFKNTEYTTPITIKISNIIFDAEAAEKLDGVISSDDNPNVDFVFNNCEFCNKCTEDWAGSVRTEGALTFIGCKFTGDNGIRFCGNSGKDVTFEDCVFELNSNAKHYAIHLEGSEKAGTLTVKNCTFNYGSIAIAGDAFENLIFEDCNIGGVSGKGRMVTIYGPNAVFTNCFFSKERCIYLPNYDATFIGCTTDNPDGLAAVGYDAATVGRMIINNG